MLGCSWGAQISKATPGDTAKNFEFDVGVGILNRDSLGGCNLLVYRETDTRVGYVTQAFYYYPVTLNYQ